MRITRSATRAAVASVNTSASNALPTGKRKLNTAADQAAPTVKKGKGISDTPAPTSVTGPTQASTNTSQNATSNPSTLSEEDLGLVPAVLTFSFEDAKQHLINIDHRFEDLFSKMACRPFQQLETVHPFR